MSASAAISAALGRVASIEKLRAKPAGISQPFVPAKAGTQGHKLPTPQWEPWIPACAGMNGVCGRRAIALFAAVRDDEGFVVEPQSAVLLQHLARRLDVARVALHVRQP